MASDVAKPYKFIGFGATDVAKPYKFTRFGAMKKRICARKPIEHGPAEDGRFGRGRGRPSGARPEILIFLSLGGPGSPGRPAKGWEDEAPHLLARFPGPPWPPRLNQI